MRRFWRAGLTIGAVLSLVAAATHVRAQTPTPSAEIGSLKLALGLVQQGKSTEALATSTEFRDPIARKLVIWLALRTDWKPVGFDRANAFLRESPEWPGATGILRRRVEALLYDEKRDPKTVRAFFNGNRPLSGEGKLALARVLLATGDKIGALPLVQSAWREDDLNASIETETLAAFPGFLTRDDHKARADRLYYAGNYSGAMRAAERGGTDLVALERARQGTSKRAANPNALINAVPTAFQNDPSLILARAEYRRRANDVDGAAKIILTAPRDPKLLVAPNEWWKEARALVRALLDKGDAKTAYRVANHIGAPDHENYKADQQFTSGWVALRFLKDPAAAMRHFKSIDAISKHPTTLSRGLYWQGRAAEAMNDRAAAQAAYERASVFSTSYYGQLARARIGLKELALNRPVEPSPLDRANFSKLEHIRALRLLYAADAAELAVPFYVDLTERAKDEASILMLAAVAYEHRDPRGMVLIGRTAYSRGVLLDTIAYPLFGIPDHPKDQPEVDRSVVYAISRQESQFTQSVVSSANAYGLMQVITPTARAIAKRLGIAFDQNKLKNDPAYNARLGAAELGHLLGSFNGSYILTFVGYNAGPGRAREWIAKYGDPRDPKVDPVDWVERVPISETRYYIQRVMENLQVYRVLFGDQRGFRIEADLSRGGKN
ncbi:MAG: lytic transglycosylase domain-containing protein [Bradyrhizobiaceae bacterium]|nr:lytic transglycosylase domain-containing protein [Bradyrhizobiaceae bacterium]